VGSGVYCQSSAPPPLSSLNSSTFKVFPPLPLLFSPSGSARFPPSACCSYPTHAPFYLSMTFACFSSQITTPFPLPLCPLRLVSILPRGVTDSPLRRFSVQEDRTVFFLPCTSVLQVAALNHDSRLSSSELTGLPPRK